MPIISSDYPQFAINLNIEQLLDLFILIKFWTLFVCSALWLQIKVWDFTFMYMVKVYT